MNPVEAIKPSPAMMKIGSIALVLAVALLAVYLANNNSTVAGWVGKKTVA